MSSITIRQPIEADFSAIAEIYSDPTVVAQTTQLPFGTADHWGNFYKQRDPNAVELVAESEGRVVGHLGILTNSAPRRRHVASFGIGVHSACHSRGIGRALMSAMIDLADNWLNIVRLELTVFVDNQAGIALYEKFGFRPEGIAHASTFTAGRYADTLSMARIRLPGESQPVARPRPRSDPRE